MKLWYSFIKELKLSSKGLYFYMEIGMAVIFLVILLMVIPENFSNKTTEFVYLDLPESIETMMIAEILEKDLDNVLETIELKSDGQIINSEFFETDDKKVYLVNSKEDLIQLADTEKKLGAIISVEENELHYEYYLQGYESEKLKNLYLIFHNKDMDILTEVFDNQRVEKLSNDFEELSDRENMIPVFLTFNGSLMGLFIIAAYIFVDKQEGIITAYAVTASSVYHYLLSKVGVILVTSICTSLILVIPIMGFQPNYLILIGFLLTTGFFISSLGLVLSSYFDNIMQAFGIIYMIIIALILPNIAYFIPSWEPSWIKFIPTHAFLQSFKEIILKNGDMNYVLFSSFLFLILGIILFVFAQYRFKKTLRVSG